MGQELGLGVRVRVRVKVTTRHGAHSSGLPPGWWIRWEQSVS